MTRHCMFVLHMYGYHGECIFELILSALHVDQCTINGLLLSINIGGASSHCPNSVSPPKDNNYNN